MTGPTTSQGKARSSQNARTHGLTAEKLQLTDDEQASFDRLKSEIRSNLNPVNEFEELCLDRIVNSAWRTHLCQIAENLALAASLRDPASEELQSAFERYHKYRRHYERSFERALKDFRLSEENRYLQTKFEFPEKETISPTLPIRQILRDFKKFQNELPQALCWFKAVDSTLGVKAIEKFKTDALTQRIDENRRLSRAMLNFQVSKEPNFASKTGFRVNYQLNNRGKAA